MNKTRVFAAIIILVAFLVSALVYPTMPNQIASHWNEQGNVDDYMSKFWGLFLIPLMSLGLFLLFILLPKIDPLKKNMGEFKKHYDRFILLFIVFLAYIHILVVSWNLEFQFDMGQMIAPAIGILFYYVGILIKNAKRNWFVGIRTPWTLSNDEVWKKTNRLGGKMFQGAGILAFFGFLIPHFAVWLIIIPILAIVVITVAYSYIEYKKIAKNEEPSKHLKIK